ncbi:hypothetical protein CR513_21901, partial [Mucuna pruriens]
WEATISAKAKSRAICSSAIWTYPKCTSRTNKLSTTDSTISSTTVPATTTIENASPRQLTISRGPNEAQPSVPPNHELQQYAVLAKYERHYPRPQDTNRTSVGSSNLPSQTIPNPRGNASAITLRTPQHLSRSTDADSKPDVDSEGPQQDKTVEINIPFLDAIKQIPKYAKFLKELCVHKRKKMKGGAKVGCIVSTLTRNENFTTRAQQALPKKCRDLEIFSVPCTIGAYTFVDAMLDPGASINVMPTSIYKSLNLGDLEPTRMTTQLVNRSVVQPLGVLEDLLVQVNELIFSADFYMLDMEDETSGKGSTLILG